MSSLSRCIGIELFNKKKFLNMLEEDFKLELVNSSFEGHTMDDFNDELINSIEAILQSYKDIKILKNEICKIDSTYNKLVKNELFLSHKGPNEMDINNMILNKYLIKK